jgi:hypothetical protein
VPPVLRASGYSGRDFGVILVDVQDYFPNRDGLEILGIFSESLYSNCVVCIYDAAGTVLFQFWHDGGFGKAYLMSEPRLLVLGGTNAKVEWRERGHPEVLQNVHPFVLVALPLEAGQISTRLMDDPCGRWYRCLLPPEFMDDLVAWSDFGSPRRGYDAARCVEVGLRLKDPDDAGVSWVVDEFGNELPGSRVWNDQYAGAAGAPPAQGFALGNLPPVESP